jgi:hypothetical protein
VYLFEIWIFFPGESASKDDLLACQLTLLKVSSVHSTSMRGSRFFESFMILCWRAGAVVAVMTCASCFFGYEVALV